MKNSSFSAFFCFQRQGFDWKIKKTHILLVLKRKIIFKSVRPINLFMCHLFVYITVFPTWSGKAVLYISYHVVGV